MDLLIAARHAKGLTQATLAARLGKPQSYVAKYENGERRLDVIEFLDITDAIGVDGRVLLDGLTETPP
ncbi:transcriptional regulator [Acidomonas methanolica NBRC 104435]|uniref:Transcriptional regulator n=2 Tax=Acidomonas methanolica TaxID=437 RepID=A0A023D781_ACIMT|nr:helix-turn-helix protein [Acidomonas methanolica]GAJ29661.1 transcriptional regulator [Acidomonas methanolica NBRC 104435]GEK99816.1 transcriptional regulator [Acidomonas methanolica NBRC 104435]